MCKKYQLRKINSNDKMQRWEAEIKGNTVTYTYGLADGKMQKKIDVFTEGKNIGRSNETTPEEQCIFEVERKVRGKIEEGFKLIGGTLTTTKNTVVESDLSVPQPMLAKKYEKGEKKKADKYALVLVQPKLDGNRCLINLKTGKLYSRKRKEIKSIPHLGKEVQNACKSLKNVTWVDGELYSNDITFNEIQSIVRVSKNIDVERAKKIKYNIYDYISDEPCNERVDKINSYIIETEYVHKVKTYLIKINEIKKYHDKFVDDGYEGIMIRIPDSLYVQKRSSGLLKYKLFFDEEFEIVGFKHEENKPDVLGSVICKMKNGVTFSARPSMTVEERDEMWKNQKSYIGKMATVKYQEKDAKSGKPRFGQLKGVRDEGDLE